MIEMLKKEIKLCLLIIFLCALVGTAGILVADNRTRQVGFADSSPSFSFKIEGGHGELTIFGQDFIIGFEN